MQTLPVLAMACLPFCCCTLLIRACLLTRRGQGQSSDTYWDVADRRGWGKVISLPVFVGSDWIVQSYLLQGCRWMTQLPGEAAQKEPRSEQCINQSHNRQPLCEQVFGLVVAFKSILYSCNVLLWYSVWFGQVFALHRYQPGCSFAVEHLQKVLSSIYRLWKICLPYLKLWRAAASQNWQYRTRWANGLTYGSFIVPTVV